MLFIGILITDDNFEKSNRKFCNQNCETHRVAKWEFCLALEEICVTQLTSWSYAWPNEEIWVPGFCGPHGVVSERLQDISLFSRSYSNAIRYLIYYVLT